MVLAVQPARKVAIAVLGALFALGLTFTGVRPVHAADHTWNVDTVLDEHENGTHNCISTPSAKCTLRAAIESINNSPANDTATINFPTAASTFLLSPAGGFGELHITGSHTVTLVGSTSGAANSIVDAQANNYRVLEIDAQITASLSNLTLRNGRADNGGGILNNGLLNSASGLSVTGNMAGAGGGVWHGGLMPLTLTDSNISNNRASEGIGAAIRSSRAVTLNGCTINNNSVTSPFNVSGGVIYALGGGNASVALTGTTVDGTSITSGANVSGGVIANDSLVTLTNSSVNSTNIIQGGGIFGGAIYSLLPSGPGPSLTNSTVNDTRIASSTVVTGGAIATNQSVSLNQSHVDRTRVTSSGAVTGGAINTPGAISLTDSSVDGTTVQGFNPTGVGIKSSTATILRSSISGNSSASSFGVARGGGIYSEHGLSLTDSSISGNLIQGSNAMGGGLFIAASGGATAINRSLIAANHADGGGMGQGGGLYLNDTPNDSVLVTNSTFSSNGAYQQGGGIYRTASSPNMMLLNSTIAGNSAPTGASIHGPATFMNTIIDSTSSSTCAGGANVSQGHNLDRGTSCGLTGPGDVQSTDPKLGPLQNNGGPTWTQALLIGSPAVDAGDNYVCLTTDQRGVTRPQGPACDIGAFEAARPEIYWIGPTSGPTAGGTLVTIIGSGFAGAGQVKFGSVDAAGFTVVGDTEIYAVSPPGTGTVHITITGAAGASFELSVDLFTYT